MKKKQLLRTTGTLTSPMHCQTVRHSATTAASTMQEARVRFQNNRAKPSRDDSWQPCPMAASHPVNDIDLETVSSCSQRVAAAVSGSAVGHRVTAIVAPARPGHPLSRRGLISAKLVFAGFISILMAAVGRDNRHVDGTPPLHGRESRNRKGMVRGDVVGPSELFSNVMFPIDVRCEI